MRPEKTVWHLCSNRWNSAITEYALRSAQALATLGWRSELSALVGSPCERRAEELKVGGPSFRFRFREVWALRRRAKALKPDVIITYGGPETFLARFLGVPVVRFRGQDKDLSEPLSRFDLTMNLGFCRGILTPARVVQNKFQAILPHKAIATVTLGLDADVFYARPRKPSLMPRLLLVGRLDPIKGHEAFLTLFKALLAEWNLPIPPPYLEIIGQSSNISAADLRRVAKGLGLHEGVHWGLVAERVPNLPERMANATLGVIPSLGSEVICRVAEEFLLSGTPILVSPVGSLAETLIREDFGAVFRDPTEGLVALRRLLFEAFSEAQSKRDERATLAAEAFGLPRMGRDLTAFLESVLS